MDFGIKIITSVKYDGRSKKFLISGVPSINTKSLSISDLIRKFSNAKLKLPDLLPLKLIKIRALSSQIDGSTTMVLSCTAGSSNKVYLIIQKTNSGVEIGVAVSLEFTLVKLIKTVTDIDLRSVPFINSLEESTMVFTASTSPMQSVILRDVFEAGSPLRSYIRGIPGGVTASLKVAIGGCLKIEVNYSNKLLTFSVPQTCKLRLSDLLSRDTTIKVSDKSSTISVSDILASDLKGMKFDPPTRLLSVNVSHTNSISLK